MNINYDDWVRVVPMGRVNAQTVRAVSHYGGAELGVWNGWRQQGGWVRFFAKDVIEVLNEALDSGDDLDWLDEPIPVPRPVRTGGA
jgi:hypothetical protein